MLAVAVDARLDVIGEQRRPTPADPDALIEAIVDAVNGLGVAVGSLGIGVAGLVTPEGVVRASPHLTRPAELDLVGRLGSRFGVAVRVENDANVATWGEAQLGAGRGVRDLVMVTLGTGIGGGIVCNGELVRGVHGFAGEPGHMTIAFDGPAHVTGLRGSWEMYASGTALRHAGDGLLDVERLATTAGREQLDAFARVVAVGVGNLIAILDPEVVVLGGGVVSIGEPLRAAVVSHLDQWVFGAKERTSLRVVLAQLGERAGAVGAALLGAGPVNAA